MNLFVVFKSAEDMQLRKLIEGRLTFRSTCRPSCKCRRWKPVTLERIVDTIMRSRLCIRLSRSRLHLQHKMLDRGGTWNVYFERIFHSLRFWRDWSLLLDDSRFLWWSTKHTWRRVESHWTGGCREYIPSPAFPLLSHILSLPLHRATLFDLFLSPLMMDLLWHSSVV